MSTDHTYFEQILNENGFTLSKPRNLLGVETTVFQRNIENWLKANNDENSRIENETSRFLKAVTAYFEEGENLSHSLTNTLNKIEILLPSLLQCLLGVSFLQTHVVNSVIIPVISRLSVSEKEEDMELGRLILKQLKRLPCLVDAKALATSLMNVFGGAVMAFQKRMIPLLPQILYSEYHCLLIPNLLETFVESPGLQVELLECFGGLQKVPTPDSIAIRMKVVTEMARAPLQDLPFYFKFMMHVDHPLSYLQEGIDEMREKVRIKRSANEDMEMEDAVRQTEILSRIRFCVSVNPRIQKYWTTKVKEDVESDMDLSTLDIIMLLVFIELEDKSATRTLQLVFKSKDSVSKMFDDLFLTAKQVIFELFKTLARFLDSTLRAKQTCSHEAASEIALKSFVSFGPLKAQHLILNLIGILITGRPSSRDAVLKTLTKLAHSEPKKLLFFHQHLTGALAYKANLEQQQMKGLMNVLAVLANLPHDIKGAANSFTQEFMILIRKQITRPELETQCIGLFGIIAAVKHLAVQEEVVQEDKITELLELAWNSSKSVEDLTKIFFDELSVFSSLLPKTVCTHFRDLLKNEFEECWAMEQKQDGTLANVKGEEGLELIPTFDANQELVLNKAPIIKLESKQMSPSVLPSHLRVILKLEKLMKGNELELEELDTLLGCPILFPKMEYYDRKSWSQHDIKKRTCLGLYLSTVSNFFRECLSGFGVTEDKELQIKLWYRLTNIVYLQKIWVQYLEDFTTPTKLVRRRGQQQTKSIEEIIHPKILTPYIRPLDTSVFKLLKYPLQLNVEDNFDYSKLFKSISKASASAVVMTAVQKFNTETLSFLLMELKTRIEGKDDNIKKEILSLPDLFSYLCSHVDALLAYHRLPAFTTTIPPSERNFCFRLLINTMTAFLYGSETVRKKDGTCLELLLLTLASRYESTGEEEEENVYRQSTKYIASFTSFITEVEDPLAGYEQVKLLKGIHDLVPSSQGATKLQIGEEINKYLCRDWKLSFPVLSFFLKTWFDVTPQVLTALQELTFDLILPHEGGQEEEFPDCSKYKSCSKMNFHKWYAAIVTALAEYVHKEGRGERDVELSYPFWKETLDLFRVLVLVSKRVQESTILVPLLKSSRIIIDVFLTGGVLLIPKVWSKNAEAGKTFTKSLQTVTRQLHMICTHAKIKKDTKLLVHVPHMKKSLEALLFRVRQSLLEFGAASAFSLGLLKHKDLLGNEILADEQDEPEKIIKKRKHSEEESLCKKGRLDSCDEEEAEMSTDEENIIPETP